MAKANQSIRLTDIANMTGYSLSTVSKALNGRSDISNEARENINAALEKTGYVKRTSQPAATRFVEVVFEDFETVWALEVLRGVLRESKKYELSVITTETGKQRRDNPTWLDQVLEHRPLGVILIFSDLTEEEKRKLEEHQIVYVIFDPAGDPTPTRLSVQADNWAGGLLATRHLLDMGHTRIGLITGPDYMLCSRARMDGYCAALAERNILVDPTLITEGNFTTPGGYAQAIELLNQPNPPTAIFAGSDLQAMGVYEAARQLALRIPDDLSVIGFDDVQPAAFLAPPLTTVLQPLQEMASEATKMLVEASKDASYHRHTILTTSLVVRNSTAAPPQQ